MADRPPQPEHFASAVPPRAPRARLNIVVGLVAALVVAGTLAGTFMARRSTASVAVRPDPQRAARRAAELARQREMRRVSRQVEAIKKRMHALAVEAGVVPAAGSDAGPPP